MTESSENPDIALPEGKSFDLRAFALDHYRVLTTMRRMMLGLGFLWVVFLIWFAILQQSIPRPNSAQWLAFSVVYSCLLFALALSIWAVWMTRLGPVALAINDDGLEFRMESGRTDLLPWGKISKGVLLLDYTETGLSAWSNRLWQMRRWNRPPTDLTRGAFDAILAAASSQGFLVTSAVDRNSRWGPCRIVRLLPSLR